MTFARMPVPVPFDLSQPEVSLMKLALLSDIHPLTLEELPGDFLEYYGIECLANSVNLKFPPLPPFDRADANSFMEEHNFPDLASLCHAISERPSDIDKLYCIFHYIGHHIRYSYASASQSPENVFRSGIAVCAGYSGLMIHIGGRCGFNQMKVSAYGNLAKGVSWDALHPPSISPNANHDSVIVELNGLAYVCEPTWGAGFLRDGQFVPQFNYKRFLLPIVQTMHDHLPLDGSESYLPCAMTYERFVRVARHLPNEHDFRNESHPFARFECLTGLLNVLFSANKGVEQLFGRVSRIVEDEGQQVDERLCTIELVSEQHGRQRWLFRIAFPAIGLYRLAIYFNTSEQTEIFVDNRRATEKIPFLSYAALGDSGFTPISPVEGLTEIQDGFALVRFLVVIRRSNLLFHIVTPENEVISGCSNRYVEYVKAIVPNNPKVYEDVVVVSFPKKGRWRLDVFLENDKGSFTQFVTYQFDVICETDAHVSPLECIPKDREVVPLVLPPNVSLSITATAVMIDTLSWELTVSVPHKLVVNLRKVGDEATIFPKEIARIEENDQNTITYELTVPTHGHYRLLMWINDHDLIEQCYTVGLPSRIVKWVEKPEESEIVPVAPRLPSLKEEPMPPLKPTMPKRMMPEPAMEMANDDVDKTKSACCLLL